MSRPNAYANFHHLHRSQQVHLKQQQQQQQPVKLKTLDEDRASAQPEPNACSVSISQRKLFRLLYAYAILLICLYLAYALYSMHRHQSAPAPESASAAALEPPAHQQRLELKLQLLERYIEVLALDLEDTRRRLALRERCDCQQSCHFNGTQHADGSSWQRHCEICQCRAGQISCSAQKCPATNCDDAIQLPNTCCPTCPKRCQLGKRQLKHNHQFRPQESPNKVCRCQDGRIKCEPTSQRAAGALIAPIGGPEAAAPMAAAAAPAPETKSRMSGALNKQQEQHDADGTNKSDSDIHRPAN